MQERLHACVFHPPGFQSRGDFLCLEKRAVFHKGAAMGFADSLLPPGGNGAVSPWRQPECPA